MQRMKWWHEAKFGIFIHFGLYSIIGRHEWVMEMEGIPVAEYRKLVNQFNPKPDAVRNWVRLAKRAGAKYVVMTTKHHEGFCLFNTKFTDYCAPRQAYGRDLVEEFVKAVRAEGLRVGFYYSLLDWYHPDGERCADEEAARRRFVDYIHGQVRELMTNYGRVDILWYDGPFPLDAEGWESKKMNRMVRELQPEIIINDRSKLPQDFSTPEQHVGESESTDCAWELCMTMNDSWGYHKSDNAWKTSRQILRYLLTCAQYGGNYLLNIGPRSDGSIPENSVRILNAVGEWMDKYGHTVYGAQRCKMICWRFANCTCKGNTLYVHVFFWPGEEWAIGGLQTKVKSARLICTGEPVEFEQNDLRIRFKGLPAEAPDEPITVLELECASAPIQERVFMRKNMPRDKV